MIKNLKRLTAISTLVLMLTFASANVALGQDAARGVYDGPGGTATQVALGSGSDPGASADPASTSAGSLPFSGLDVGLALGGALLLIGAGVALSRVVVRGENA